MRAMEINLPAPLSEGRTAVIYPWGDGLILKLFRDWCPTHWAEQEAAIVRAICAAGIPTPAVGDMLEVNQRRGLIYERVEGISMLQDLNTHPENLISHAKTLAELQAGLHRLSIPGLRSYKQALVQPIRQAPYLDEDTRTRLLEKLAGLRDADKLCHADFHPGNILMSVRGAVIIDWMTACTGNPWADVARSSLLLTVGAQAEGKKLNPLLRLMISLYHRQYLKHYQAHHPDTQNELRQWLPVIAAGRLEEKIQPERESLLKLIRAGLRV